MRRGFSAAPRAGADRPGHLARRPEAAFEHLWTTRDTHLKEVPGFVEFHLLKGPQKDDHVLYSSHTIWKDYESFEAWTKSDAFPAAHRSAGGNNRVLYLGHPEFEGFEVIQTVK
ncbi:antibiotic biosynthesis monooxygenase family protein [Paraburkholderia aspalathi]|uniref:antibiotic biosynthesis monooxygenase family protein n=1 Tax=Paraburkholderia aspalathi TaxID=1324617 RepID=UPI0038BC4CCC